MNSKEAVVTEIRKTDIVTYIDVQCGDETLRLIRQNAPIWLAVGDSIYCKFQEVSVCVSKECQGKVSIENKIPAILKNVRQNNSLCELTFESSMGTVISLITQDAYNLLGLKIDCEATMLLRGVDITIEPRLDLSRIKDAS
ncbi:MAG: hypothetical protein JXQ67_07610 [Campylobacterales bacterium]|nr:hypothetical protein [Campylobacterales bacterium]